MAAPASDSLTDIAAYLGNQATSFLVEGQNFVNSLSTLKATDFFLVGDLPALGYIVADFTQELQDIKTNRPTRPDLSITDLQTLLDQLAALPQPAAPTLTAPNVVVPDLSAQAPTINLPAAPSTDVGAIPNDTIDITDPVLPDAPNVVLPAVPTFEELAIPAPPSITIPSFNASVPPNTLTAPSVSYEYVEQAYSSQLKDPLTQKLLGDLLNGGYGIEPSDEQALWNRARDREVQATNAQIEEIRRNAAASGFPLPQGALLTQLQRAQQDLLDKSASLSREVALKRADLYVANRQFTIEQVQQTERMAIDLFNSIAERSMNHAKNVVELGVAIYDANVRNYATQLQAFEAESRVFETRVRAELAKAEIYRTQVDASKIQLDAQRSKVDVYRAQLDGVQTVVNVYKSRVEAATLIAQLQQAKLEAVRLRVQVFAERVRAKEVEFRLYEAQQRGELTKVEVYRSQLEAYTTQLKGLELKASIALQNSDLLVKQYGVSAENYKAALGALVQRIRAKIDANQNGVQVYNTDVNAYRALVDGLVQSANVKIANQRLNNEWNLGALNSQVERAKFNLQKLVAQVDNLRNINQWGAEFYRTALGAATAGINGLSVKTVSG